jgi:type II secretion system protein J
MTAPRHILHSSGGFTLIEIVLATAVSAIVLLAIQTVFFGALRLSTTTQNRTDRELEVHRALDLVQRDLAGLMVPSATLLTGMLQTNADATTATSASGERVSPDFYTTSGKIDGWNPFSEAQAVAYYLAPATDGSNAKNLVRTVTRNLLPVQNTTTDDDDDSRVVLTGVTSAVFEFYDGTAWTDYWDSTTSNTTTVSTSTTTTTSAAGAAALPTAIRFSVGLVASDGNQTNQAPIEIVVPVFVMSATAASAASTAASTGGMP